MLLNTINVFQELITYNCRISTKLIKEQMTTNLNNIQIKLRMLLADKNPSAQQKSARSSTL